MPDWLRQTNGSSESLTITFIPFISAAIVIATWLFQRWQFNKKYKLPVRIPGVPFFGNSFQLPPLQQGPWAKKMAEKYGEMYAAACSGIPEAVRKQLENDGAKKCSRFTCKFGNTTWVFLNSSRTVNDLLERRAALYSSRPKFPMTQDIMSGGSRIVLMPYDSKWKLQRKIMHRVLTARQDDVFMPFQDLESKHLCWDYLEKPDRWWSANGRYANSVIMSVVFGCRSVLDDPDVVELFETLELFLENQQPGVNVVDGFPILSKLPKRLQWWRPRGERIFEKTINVYKRNLAKCEERIRKGTQRQCFVTDFLASEEVKSMSETEKLFTLGSLMEAGSDTSRVTIGQIIAGAVTYPDWVARAREHLDAVCGYNAERLPQWSDKPKLKYINGVVKEGFRWRPNIAEIGAPHMLIKDDEYEGYRFPAGTVFTWNAWAIALDSNEYKEPERFWPERFLNGEEENALKGHWAFGPGRRVCAGWKVGEMNVWIAIARLLYCFDFTEVPGQPIDTMTIPQITKHTAPFAVKVTPRSPAHAKLVRRDCEEAVNTVY